jgi:hypothetical protein
MLQNRSKSNFQKVIEIVEALPDEEQKDLIRIIDNRLKARHKKGLLEAVKESRDAFARCDVKSGSLDDLMAELEEDETILE